MIKSSCHCGAVELEIAELPATLTSCNCSICRRTGALYGYYNPRQVNVIAASGATFAYGWGDKMIAFHYCKTCGCHTHYTNLTDQHKDRMGVNMRMLEPKLLEGVRVRRLDGADTWKFLD